MRNDKLFFRPPFKVGIRAQLTALVSIVALLSLTVLAIITGIYFTSNYKSLRLDRLYIAAQLKSSQLDQNLNYLYYQARWLATQDTLETALANYVAGNKSAENWEDIGEVIQKFLGSSNLFSVAVLYDSQFDLVLAETNNGTGDLIPKDVMDKLLPLDGDEPLPASLENTGILTDPVINDTYYLMSMSLPIFANPSIVLSEERVYGYITIIMSAEGLQTVFNDTTALERSSVSIVSAVYNNETKLSGYHFVFPPQYLPGSFVNETFPLKNDSFLSSALRQGKGGSLQNTPFFVDNHLAVGYSPCTFDLVNWVAVVTQARSEFLSPVTKITKIIAGTVVGIGVFVCLITFPIAHWAVKPIVRLQKATELITEGRGLRQTSSLSRTSSLKGHPLSSGLPSLSSESSTNYEKAPLQPMDSGSDGNIASNGSLNHDLFRHISANNESDRHSKESRRLTTSANLAEARLPTYRRLFLDELSNLTDTFNTMTDALDEHYALLEDRVRARTKQLEAAKIEAEAANEAKTVFIANISHELRTPLNGILGMTAISMEENDISKIQSSLKLIFRSGELLLHILTELLTFSKNVLQRTKLEKRNFCLTDVALQIKSIFNKVAKDQHVKLTILLSPNIIRTMILWGDSNRIIQVVMNLVSNALKFTPVDGEVDVNIKLLGEYDEDRSKKANYKAVYVKEGTELENTEPLIISPIERISPGLSKVKKSSFKKGYNSVQSIGVDENESSGQDSEPSDRNDKPVESHPSDLEVGSIISQSTSSYDDAIFNSQFQKETNLYDDSTEDSGIELSVSKKWVFSIEVKDTGPGIDQALHDSVFEPFVQGDQTLSRQYGGTGLGLSICRQLATMMHGTMLLESKLGVGSKFTFMVPLLQTKELKIDDPKTAFDDEFNAFSRKNRKVKFKMSQSRKNSKSSNSFATLGNSSSKPTDNVESTSNASAIPDTRNLNIKPNESSERRSEISTLSTQNTGERKTSNNGSKGPYDRPFLQSTGTATSSMSVPQVDSKSASTNSSVANMKSTNNNVTDNSGTNEKAALRILVAEDNHVNQEVIRRMLNLEGITNVDLACDGQEAFDKVKELVSKGEHYDMLFMDVQMPKVDGLLSTRLIRNDLKYKYPIVALTAFADDSNIKECLEAGMDGFLSKPIKRSKLKTILSNFTKG